MATLELTVKGSFGAGDADRLYITRDPADSSKFNAEVQFSVENGTGNEVDRWSQHVADVNPLSVSTWFNAAFRAQAWADYKAARGYTEV